MEIIDATGKPCPIPVIETKREIKKTKKGIIKTLVDNKISAQNVTKMANSYGLTAETTQNKEGIFEVIIQVTESVPAQINNEKEFVVAIGAQVMGTGDDKLGRNLMKAFIQSLTELDKAPTTLLFFNGGAKLTVKNASTLIDIEALHTRGVHILTCGACLDFFELTDHLAVGEITNMYTIATIMAEADDLVQLS